MHRGTAVTVTYNDAEYMRICVEHLCSQTYPLHKVIIVDNNSNEANKAIIGEIKAKYQNAIEVLELKENLGGAGGFESGMRYAKEQYDPDWYWIMDADAYPESDCLEKLLDHCNDKENIGYLAPLIYGVDLKAYQLYHHKRATRYLERDIPLYSDYSEIPVVSEIICDAFVGPLFSKNAVDLLGFPDGGLFIYGDDMEYTYRVTRKFSALLIKDAVINHRDQPASNGVQQPKNWWKDYYMYRNRLLFIYKYQDSKFKAGIGFLLVWLRIFKQNIICLRTIKNAELKTMRTNLLRSSYKDGIKRISGKTINPKDFIEKINKALKGT